jgi:hypothetical protein
MLINIKRSNLTMVAKLKLKDTKQTGAVTELLCRIYGVPYRSTTILTRLGGSFVGIKEATQAKQVRELVERFIR